MLLPEWRGRGLGWRAQALLCCDYLFSHTPVQRIQAGTHAENAAEQRRWRRPASNWRGLAGL
ncbi:GNAT family protein [Micromonospora sp. b486]|nr:GNAT family protein [Micromonospora sp. b486]MDM4784511.1 GNAT family protein [Micromonospora sp. b486]